MQSDSLYDLRGSLAGVPTLEVLPRAYRLLLRLTRRRGLFTLARWHHRVFRRGQIVILPGKEHLFIPHDPHYFGFLTGLHEEHVRTVIDETLKQGDRAVDVGANIGYFAVMMATRAGSAGKVLPIEPVSQTYEALEINARIARNKRLNLHTLSAAISNLNGEVVILRQEHSTLNQVRALEDRDTSGLDRVEALTLPDALERGGLIGEIHLLKVDVEGHELAVIEGAVPLFESGTVRRMIVEITPGEDAKKIAAIFVGCGANWLCWLDGAWRHFPLETLPARTDVLVEFRKCR